ncbi:non-ribosomal peptide synthetase [Lysobacter antibioticus]|uniref:Amino acid adenylation domain protein n=1 Tax=Lysobacter antibioticus TaxID=84531 RepID=A0A0S2FCW4_LYSAN|nr:non-ribosomal peptide synthetase [Lysobacter antibioticus]ALN81390.1 amino acid adenylation domain protein [Lysobacter antibioticus]
MSAPSNDETIAVPDARPGHADFPLTDMQRLLVVSAADGMEYALHPHLYFEVERPGLDIDRFVAAIARVLERHRRNIVAVTPDLRLRQVEEVRPPRVSVWDLRGLSDLATTLGLMQVRHRMSNQALPMDRWPWLDFQLTRYGDRDVRLHVNFSNLFLDQFSGLRLLSEVEQYYAIPDTELPADQVGIAEVSLALAQRHDAADRARAYWADRVATLPAPPELPLVRLHGNPGLNRRRLVVDAATWGAFTAGVALHGMSPVTALLAVYGEIVARFSGSRHFILNQMMTRRLLRRIPGAESVLGNLGAIYPLEFDWRATASLLERAHRLQATIIGDLGRTDWSGVDVLEALNARHRAQGSAACPFVVSSGLAGGEQEEFGYSKLATPQVLLDHQFFLLRGGRIEIVWDVVEAAFPAGFIDALCNAHEALIRRLADDPQAWTATTTLVAARSTAPPVDTRPTRPLHVGRLSDGLKVGACVAPEHPAVVCGEDWLSYGELAAAAESLAKVLCAHGVRPGDRVAIVLAKGVPQMIAVYAALLAGAAYVPMDPAWPPRRIDQLISDIGAAVVVGADAGERQGVPVVAVRGAAAASASAAGAGAAGASMDLPAGLDPSAPAYVIYTSGSTGQPKGVVLDHRGPVNTILDVNDEFGIVAEDVVFGVSSLSFDLSVYDIFGSAMAGATLVLPDPADHSPHAWLAAMVERGVTVWNSAPPLMQLLVDVARAEGVQLPALRIVMLSGDWIALSLPEDIKAIAPNAKVISLGGATEASIWSIWHPIDAVDPKWRSIPYGRPMANQPWYVLDEQGNETPTWTTGQLHIGGVGLAQGYWGDPEKTSAAFVAHPATGERIYRTGDLGRLLPDGNIELIGRIDAQCKIQGHRVEPGEVEHVLVADPRVKDAVVVVAGEARQKQLRAFVVLHEGSSPNDGESIRASLVDRLPSYLIPSQITVVAGLPVTSNGKLDRGALLALAEPAAEAGAQYLAPRTDLERTIVAVWKEVLGIETIGVEDDFFNLGGQSFTALRAVAALRSRTKLNISLGGLLESRTVARLASLMTGQRLSNALVPLHPGTGSALFMVHPAGGSVAAYRDLARDLDRASFGLAASEPMPATVEALAQGYVAAVRAAAPGPYTLSGWSSGAVIALEMAAQLEAAGEQVAQLIVFDAPAPMDPPPGPVDEETLQDWFREDTAGADLLATELHHVYPVFAHVVNACRSYKPPVVTADVALIRARDGRVSEYATHLHEATGDWGWSACTRGTVATRVVAGTHHSLFSSQHLAEVVAAVRELAR